MSNIHTGGCICGAVRYRISAEPALQLFCFCSDCRQRTGSDSWAGFMVPDDAFEVLQGEPTVWEKTSSEGRTVRQHFCGTCGANLWGYTELGITSVAAGSLDEPDRFSPQHRVFTDQAAPWARVPQDLQDL